MQNFNLGPYSAKVLSETLMKDPNFTSYNLANNTLSNDGCAHLFSSQIPNHITSITLSGNGITSEGMQYLV